jgi:streptogramin lyase
MLATALRLSLALALTGPGDPVPVSSSARLQLLPDGLVKRQFILDCTGCHQFDAQVTQPDGAPRSRDEWVAAVRRMLGFAGATTGFPVIAAGRDPEATADWLSRELARAASPASLPPPPAIGEAEVREYLMPEAGDLPHDVAVDGNGDVIVTGMFSHVMYRLDPVWRFTAVALPAERRPRAVEVDAGGAWWCCWAPQLMARYTPATGTWNTWPMGMYPRSVALD